MTKSKIRFADAARAIKVTPKALRNWLQRNEIALFSDYTGRNWAEFSRADIALLAIMREMVAWGIGVDKANEAAKSAFETTVACIRAAAEANSVKPVIVVHRDGDKGAITVDVALDRTAYHAGYPSMLMINVGHTLSGAFFRLEGDPKFPGPMEGPELVAKADSLIEETPSLGRAIEAHGSRDPVCLSLASTKP